MSNSLLTIDMITKEALVILHQKANFLGSINRTYDDSFAKPGAKIGDTLRIRLPNKYSVRTGRTLDVQDTTETSVSMTVATQKGVDMYFSSDELALSIDQFNDRILEPAVNSLVSAIEADAIAMRADVYQQANNTAAAITLRNVLTGRQKLVDALAPAGPWTALMRTQDNADLVDANKGLFQSATQIAEQYRDGMMGRTAGFDFYENTHLSTQTRGSANGSYVVTTTVATQGATTVDVQTGTGTFKVGDIVTFAGVNRVHPESKEDTGVLHQFVVTANSAGGSVTLAVSPAMYTTGARQNISAFPTATAAVTIAGTASTAYGQSMVYHRDAFAFATADLPLPDGVDFARRKVLDGVSLRIIRGYNINDDTFPCRIDVLYGYKTIRPQLACRLANLAG